MDSLVQTLVKLTNLANKLPQKSKEQLLVKVDTEEDEEQAKQIRKRSTRTMNALLSLVSYVQPELKSRIGNLKKSPGSLLDELTSSSAGGLQRYEELVERVTDDLLENVNNQIDLYKKEQENPSGVIGNIPVRTEVFAPNQQQLMRTDNTMMKP